MVRVISQWPRSEPASRMRVMLPRLLLLETNVRAHPTQPGLTLGLPEDSGQIEWLLRRQALSLLRASTFLDRQRRHIVDGEDRQRFTAISHGDLVPR